MLDLEGFDYCGYTLLKGLAKTFEIQDVLVCLLSGNVSIGGKVLLS